MTIGKPALPHWITASFITLLVCGLALLLLPASAATRALSAPAAPQPAPAAPSPAYQQDMRPTVGIAIVNEDRPMEMADAKGSWTAWGDEITKTIKAGLTPESHISARELSSTAAMSELDRGVVAAVVVIGPDFSPKLAGLMKAGVTGGAADKPVLGFIENPAGDDVARKAVDAVRLQVIEPKLEEIGGILQKDLPQYAELSGVGRAVTPAMGKSLDEPAMVKVSTHAGPETVLEPPYAQPSAPPAAAEPRHAEPSVPAPVSPAFDVSLKYSLLLVLAGLLGAVLVGRLADRRAARAAEGSGTVEGFGAAEESAASAWRVAGEKWWGLAMTGMLTSAAFVGVVGAAHPRIAHPSALWAFGALLIVAVGTAAQAVRALAGHAAVALNLLGFALLALPAAGLGLLVYARRPAEAFWGTVPAPDVRRTVEGLISAVPGASPAATTAALFGAVLLLALLACGIAPLRRRSPRLDPSR